MPQQSRKKRAFQTTTISTNPEMVQDGGRVADIAKRLAERPLIAFDTEFLREKTFFPQLGLLQVADRQDVWLIDPLSVPADEMQPLLDVFTNPEVVKAAHSAEQDQECLFHHYGLVAAPLFDTSIGAALTGRGDQIGLAALLRKTLGVDLPKGHTRTNWLKRPLQPAMAEYAALDVLYLVELAELLLADLSDRGRREWALKLSAELTRLERFEGDGQAVARKLAPGSRLSKREYAILKELTEWREKRVRKANIPRRWLADDGVLLQLARAKPSREADLADFRGLGSRVRDFGAAYILAAIRRGLELAESDLEEPPRKAEPNQRELSAVNVLKCFLNFLAQENDVPLRYLIDNDTPLLLLRGKFRSVEQLRQSGLLTDGALDIFGEEILGILGGRQALKIQRGRAVRFDPGPQPSSAG